MQQADSSDPYIDPFHVHEEIRAGDSLLYSLNFQPNGTGPQDVTGYIFVFTVKRSKTDPDSQAVAQTFYTCQPGTVSQIGVVAFEALTRQQSGIIPPDETYLMDIRYLTPADQSATIVEGELTVIRPVGQNLTPP
jgi:hypothetical protein